MAFVLPVSMTMVPFGTAILQPVPDFELPFHVQLFESWLFVTVPEVPPVKASVMVVVLSVNVVCAWETEPTAVRVNFTLRS